MCREVGSILAIDVQHPLAKHHTVVLSVMYITQGINMAKAEKYSISVKMEITPRCTYFDFLHSLPQIYPVLLLLLLPSQFLSIITIFYLSIFPAARLILSLLMHWNMARRRMKIFGSIFWLTALSSSIVLFLPPTLSSWFLEFGKEKEGEVGPERLRPRSFSCIIMWKIIWVRYNH